ncbi:MAG: FHA domain-containing protein [Myxococcota bacterium]
MIICGTCHKENEDFFKFCLGCGADLAKAARVDEGATVESGGAKSSAEAEPEPMTRRAGGGGSPPQVSSSLQRTCRICGASQAPDFAFCADCGASFAELTKTGPVPAVTARPPRSGVAKGRLVLVREDGTDGESFSLDADGAVVGRDTGHITFPEDDFLASEHLELTYEGDELRVHPHPSTNGVYIRVFDQVQLAAGDRLRIGQELLEYSVADQSDVSGTPDREGTLPLGSPVPKDAWGRLVQLLGPERLGQAFVLRGKEVFIGRERGDIRFPLDGYVSGSHAVLSKTGSGVSLRDLGSSNGTFIRLREDRLLRQGDFILVGQQLLRFEP